MPSNAILDGVACWSDWPRDVCWWEGVAGLTALSGNATALARSSRPAWLHAVAAWVAQLARSSPVEFRPGMLELDAAAAGLPVLEQGLADHCLGSGGQFGIREDAAASSNASPGRPVVGRGGSRTEPDEPRRLGGAEGRLARRSSWASRLARLIEPFSYCLNRRLNGRRRRAVAAGASDWDRAKEMARSRSQDCDGPGHDVTPRFRGVWKGGMVRIHCVPADAG